MIDLLTELWKADSSNVMVFANLILLIVVGIVAWQAFRFFFKDYQLNVKKLEMLTEKSLKHDDEHIKIYNRMDKMLVEMKNNREQDQKQANVTHALVQFLAKKSKIEIPEL